VLADGGGVSSVTVLGAGVSGLSLALMARRLGCDVFLSEAREISPDAREILEASRIECESGGHTDRIFERDTVVLGSGFPPSAEIIERMSRRGVVPTGEIDFVMPHIRGKVVGVTGSNGKTTTTSLIGHLLKSSGYNAAVAGNIGRPLADAAGAELEFTVVELSSFQLHWVRSARLAGAVVTNLAPDHIDWHGSYEKYAAAKARILSMVSGGGFSIVQRRDIDALGAAGEGVFALSWDEEENDRAITLSERERAVRMDGRELFGFDDVKLIGSHNLENAAMAAAAVKLLGRGGAGPASAALPTFTPPPHRCGLVAVSNGVRYVDDSKGTNIAAAVAAMTSIEGRKIIILGGRGKGEDYGELVQPLRENAKLAILIGEEADAIERALESGGYDRCRKAGDMESAVRTAAGAAEPGDVVLLSPACTSWDAYRNYNERGDHFASLVVKHVKGELI
jgi:UDP-N-acetylmuramoylalanine--D-glutamate ligase